MMFGGFSTNFLWCVLLYIKNKTGHEFFSPRLRDKPGFAKMRRLLRLPLMRRVKKS